MDVTCITESRVEVREARQESARRECAESGGRCSQAGRGALRHDAGGERATLSSHYCSGLGQGLRSYRHGIARAWRAVRSRARQCDKQGPDAHENPRFGVSLNARAGRWIGGHRTEPYGQNTQQSPGFGLSLSPHPFAEKIPTSVSRLIPAFCDFGTLDYHGRRPYVRTPPKIR
jgi:hypothetical protein